MTETIDLTPRGLETPEGIQRVNSTTRVFEDATMLVANAATEFFRDNSMILMKAATGIALSDEECITLREGYKSLIDPIETRRQAHEEFLRAVAGQPEQRPLSELLARMGMKPDTVHHLTEKVYGGIPNTAGPWALYIFGDDGLHSGRQYFAKTVQYSDEQITVKEAMWLAMEAVAEEKEVRVCDMGDMLVWHSKDGHTTYGEGFWEKIS